MSTFLSLVGVGALLFGGYVAATSLRTDVQLTIVGVSFIGGFLLLGVSRVLIGFELLDDRIDQLEAKIAKRSEGN